MKQITNNEDIEIMVDTFYDAIRKDGLLGPVFHSVIKDSWPEHLDTMYRFWKTILLGEHTYQGAPFASHRKLPLEAHHFERWLALFNASIDKIFEGEKVDEAKWRAQKMAEMFQYKLNSNNL